MLDITTAAGLDELQLIPRFVTSLGIGLLMGLERERAPQNKAGIRTFGLVAVFGSLCALLTAQAGLPWLLPAGVLALSAVMISAYRKVEKDEDPGTTSVVALLLCYGLGALCAYGYLHLAVAGGLVATSLLYFKTELHGFPRRLSRADWVSLLQFAAVTFVILPVLPDQGFGPHGALNPYRIWLMVVLVSGLSLAGYVALRLTGEDRALPLIGLLGGVVSSTATTLAFSRHARRDEGHAAGALCVILVANLTVLLRLGVMAAIVAPVLLPQLTKVLGLGLLTGVAAPLMAWRRLVRTAERPSFAVGNPSSMRVALGFAAVYAVVLVATQDLHRLAGPAGLYAAATVSGLTDMDAIALSSFQMATQGQLPAVQAVRAIALAFAANSALKLGVVAAIAGGRLARGVALGYASVLAGLAYGALVLAA
ncbi:MAG: MgtC/SapB family protein [Nevskia sp.]|nr:MgtC/SapB family protein [Nevskia sp.]